MEEEADDNVVDLGTKALFRRTAAAADRRPDCGGEAAVLALAEVAGCLVDDATGMDGT